MHNRDRYLHMVHAILHLVFKVRNAGCRGSEQTLIAVEQLALKDGYEWEEQ